MKLEMKTDFSTFNSDKENLLAYCKEVMNRIKEYTGNGVGGIIEDIHTTPTAIKIIWRNPFHNDGMAFNDVIVIPAATAQDEHKTKEFIEKYIYSHRFNKKESFDEEDDNIYNS